MADNDSAAHLDLFQLRIAAGLVAVVALVGLIRGSWVSALLVAVDAVLRGWRMESIAPSTAAARMIAPRLRREGGRAVAVAPQRTAARTTAVLAVAATATLAARWYIIGNILLAPVVLFAVLESLFAVCLPCIAHEIVAARRAGDDQS